MISVLLEPKGATQEARFISFCRLLPPRQIAKLLGGNKMTGAGDGNRTQFYYSDVVEIANDKYNDPPKPSKLQAHRVEIIVSVVFRLLPPVLRLSPRPNFGRLRTERQDSTFAEGAFFSHSNCLRLLDRGTRSSRARRL